MASSKLITQHDSTSLYSPICRSRLVGALFVVYLLCGGGLGGAIFIFIVLKMLGK